MAVSNRSLHRNSNDKEKSVYTLSRSLKTDFFWFYDSPKSPVTARVFLASLKSFDEGNSLDYQYWNLNYKQYLKVKDVFDRKDEIIQMSSFESYVNRLLKLAGNPS